MSEVKREKVKRVRSKRRDNVISSASEPVNDSKSVDDSEISEKKNIVNRIEEKLKNIDIESNVSKLQIPDIKQIRRSATYTIVTFQDGKVVRYDNGDKYTGRDDAIARYKKIFG
jgi:hypothetical protein